MKHSVALAALAFVGMLAPARLDAMPVFAEAYGYDCQKCHIQVPALNSYGRSVQRSMYAALDRQTLARGVPLWVGESASYDTQAPNEPHHVQFGNLAVHAVGFLDKNVTYHIQQWITQNDLPGGLDTAWVSYDHIYGANAHLAVGKQPPPGPSFFSQWSDFSPFALPSITVGEHAQGLQNNRWGAKLGYAGPRYIADAGWFGSSADLNGATDFSPSNDKTFQWNAAYSPVDQPLQVGTYGNVGTFPLAEGGVDRYSALALYAQLDPSERWPGGLFIVQHGRDTNPGQGALSATSMGYSAAIFWHPLRHWESLISLRHEVTNDGLNAITQSNNADFAIRVARYVHATLEAATATGGKPAWRYFIWWTTPVRTALPAPPQAAAPASSVVKPGAGAGAGANAAGSAGATGGSAAVVHLKDLAYSPPTITVKVGETVQFVNDDPVAHTVTASDKSFDSGNMNQNATWSYVFAKAGSYSYICTFHANMKGSIIVGQTSAVDATPAGSSAKKASSVAKKASAVGKPAGSTAATARSGAAVVHIKGFAYSPLTLTVKVGQTVRFVNDDATPHTVTASDKSFDSGSMNQNAAWSHAFKKAGSYPYICTYHANMKGSIIVR